MVLVLVLMLVVLVMVAVVVTVTVALLFTGGPLWLCIHHHHGVLVYAMRSTVRCWTAACIPLPPHGDYAACPGGLLLLHGRWRPSSTSVLATCYHSVGGILLVHGKRCLPTIMRYVSSCYNTASGVMLLNGTWPDQTRNVVRHFALVRILFPAGPQYVNAGYTDASNLH